MGVATMANKNTLFVTLVGCATQFEASFSPYSTNLLCLRVAKVPRRQDQAIFLHPRYIQLHE